MLLLKVEQLLVLQESTLCVCGGGGGGGSGGNRLQHAVNVADLTNLVRFRKRLRNPTVTKPAPRRGRLSENREKQGVSWLRMTNAYVKRLVLLGSDSSFSVFVQRTRQDAGKLRRRRDPFAPLTRILRGLQSALRV